MGDFLDKFYKNPDWEIIKDEPDFSNSTKEERAYIAALADYLGWNYLGKTSKWCQNPDYVLDEPWFACKKGSKMMAVSCIESPTAFKARNIFISRNGLNRV